MVKRFIGHFDKQLITVQEIDSILKNGKCQLPSFEKETCIKSHKIYKCDARFLEFCYQSQVIKMSQLHK